MRLLPCSCALTLGLVLTACGSDDELGADSLPEATLPAPEPADRDLTPAAALAQALDAMSTSSEPFRVTMSTGMVQRLPAEGVDVDQPLDPDVAASVTEVDAEGDTHVSVDVSALFAGYRDEGDHDLDLGLEIWSTPTRAVVDTSDFIDLALRAPGYGWGAYAPGMFEIDLAAAVELGTSELAGLVGASTPLPPVEIARALRASVESVEPVDGDPNSFRATVPLATLVEVQGDSIDARAVAVASSMAQQVQVEPAELAAALAEFYESRTVDLEVTLDPAGTVRSIGVQSDMSELYATVFGPGSGLFDTEAEQREAEQATEGAELRLEVLLQFEVDPTIDVELPAGEFEDRTALFVEMAREAGF